MVKSNLEIKTRIMSQVDGSGKLTIRVNNGWSFWTNFTVQNNQAIRDYLKSDDFKEFVNTLYSKYENLTYKEMCDLRQIDYNDDKKKVEEKLDRFLWKRVEEEPFKVNFSVKYKRRYSNAFTYKVVFYNNKNNKKCWANRTFFGDIRFRVTFGPGRFERYIREEIQNCIDALTYELEHCKELTEKLNSYKSWDEVWVDKYNSIDKSLMAIVDDVIEKFETEQDKKHVA
jgi:hypothetical protein